jgi:hypothetical protein
MEVEIEGLAPLLRKLDELGKGKYIDPMLKLIGEDVRNAVQPYPPKPAGSTYKRTRRLDKNWYVRPTAQMSVDVGVNPDVTYAVFVQGDKQTGKHASTGWKVLSRTAEAMKARELEKVRRAIRRIIG